MTVWTTVSLQEVNQWLAARGLGKAAAITPIEEGVEDSIYRLQLTDGSGACLRLFERTEPQGPLEIAACLAAYGLPTCPPFADKQGRLWTPLKDKPAAVYPWIDGAWVPEPSLMQIEAIGAFLGQIAAAGPKHCANWVRENPRGWDWMAATAKALAAVLDAETQNELESEVSAQLAYWQPDGKIDVPRGPIHADLFRNNALFDKEGKLAAVFDWGFCASGFPLIFDLAIVANDWCLQKGTYALDKERLDALLRGRCGLAPFTESENAAWGMALRWAALRFWLSRLYDWHLPRDTCGHAHDPKPFQEILRERKKM
jgi:homoserine kinase type II